MWFKVKNTDVKISFTFFALLLLIILLNKTEVYFLSLSASFLHESVHILFIKQFGGYIKRVSFNLFGGEIERDVARFDNIKEALINISAPVTNIVIGAVVFYFFGTDNLFGSVNLFLGVFNILPFHSFDGGRALYEILLIKLKEITAQAILTVLSVIVTICFSFVSVHVFFYYSRNFMLISMSVFLIFSVVCDIIKVKKTNCKDL